ncbi:MAG: TonB-dependent hemoglobin/transferrin/lactoferrin family receptor, partial [Sphingomonas sp.]
IGGGWRDRGGRFGGQVIATHSANKETDRAGGGYTPPAFTTLDFTAFAKVTDSITLRGGVFNLTDESYAWWSDVRGLSPSSTIKDAYTQPGRNGSVSVSFRF